MRDRVARRRADRDADRQGQHHVGDWGDDGYIYFEVDSGIARMRATGGEIEPVYTIQPKAKEIATEWVHVLPGAHRRRCSGSATVGQGPADFEIMAMPLPHGPAHSLVRGVYATYAPTGHLLVVTADGKLIAIPFDPKKLELTGAPIALLEGIGVRNGGFNIDLALAGNGTLAYTTGGTLGSRRAAWVSREGAGDAGGLRPGIRRASSSRRACRPTGRRWRWPDARRAPRHLGQAAPLRARSPGSPSRDTSSGRPAWSADGRDVLYVADRSGSGVGPLYARRADGTGAAAAADLGDGRRRPGRWPRGTAGG